MNEKKSVLIISQYFYPEQFRINDLAIEMKNRGYEVTVLTGLPNYPKGEYFKGYSKDKTVMKYGMVYQFTDVILKLEKQVQLI